MTFPTNSIDILINNAGVTGPDAQDFGETDDAAWLDVMKVNALGALQVARRSSRTSSEEPQADGRAHERYGQHRGRERRPYAYRCSKAALNMILRCMAADLRVSVGVIALSVNPRWVRTEMGGASARMSPEQSVTSLRRIFDRVRLEDSGKFLNWNGPGVPLLSGAREGGPKARGRPRVRRCGARCRRSLVWRETSRA